MKKALLLIGLLLVIGAVGLTVFMPEFSHVKELYIIAVASLVSGLGYPRY